MKVYELEKVLRGYVDVKIEWSKGSTEVKLYEVKDLDSSILNSEVLRCSVENNKITLIISKEAH